MKEELKENWMIWVGMFLLSMALYDYMSFFDRGFFVLGVSAIAVWIKS